MMFRAAFATIAAVVLVSTPSSAQQRATAAQFNAPPSIWAGSISPDGNFVAAIQRVDQGHALVVVDWRTRQARAIQVAREDRSLYLDWVVWKNDNRLIFSLRQHAVLEHADNTGTRQSQGRSEEFDVTRVFGVNRDGSGLTQMFEGQMRRLAADFAPVVMIDRLPNDADHVLLGTYGQRGFGLFRANISNGQAQEVETGAWETWRYITDGAGEAVMRVDDLPSNSGWRIFRRAPGARRWEVAHEVRRSSVAQNREFDPLQPGPGPGQVWVAARPEGAEYQGIYLYDTRTGELGPPVYGPDDADGDVAWIQSDTHALILGCAERRRRECRAADPQFQRHLDGLNTYFENSAAITLANTSHDGSKWLLYVTGPTIPGAYYVYDVTAAHVEVVSSAYPQVPRASLSPITVVEYSGRDGTALWGYLTTPAGGASARPLVVMPHGGPETRDSYGYDFFAQFLASRGYLVFQPNFRGSEGSGRTFRDAGRRQWGRTMQDDITDGVRHLIETGVADRERVCIVGISYGGYAALVGAALTPELYRCSVSIAGDTDLIETLDLERQNSGRTSTNYAYWRDLIGDANTDQAALIAVSLRRQVANIRGPVLLIHGTQDEIVYPSQSERMRDALQRAGKDVRYVALTGEGHPWRYWQESNRLRVLQETEAFLAANLGPSAQ